MLNTCWRHHGTRRTEILLTNPLETVTCRENGGIYLCRRWIELLMMEPKGIVGLGPQQITGKADRVDIRAR